CIFQLQHPIGEPGHCVIIPHASDLPSGRRQPLTMDVAGDDALLAVVNVKPGCGGRRYPS
ncbi:hypothetical protein PPMP20_39630, partial [Paraburkholderia phymatum]|uniref:hypothetical protein n=1 Tax=Paraburkholderia phymatum TaxID=148447 RepID=UPI0032AEA5AA